MSAIRRVERLLAVGAPPTFADMRALLALAKSAAELKRRIRKARRGLRPGPSGNVMGPDEIEDLLDLRKGKR